MINGVGVEQLTLKTASKTLLKIDQMHVKAGTRAIIMGPSGAGKSTLLKCIALLLKQSSGTIEIFGQNTSLNKSADQVTIRKKIVYVAQQEVMFQKTVSDNIGMGLKFRKISKQDRSAKVSEMLQLVGLFGYENRDAQTLSGGEIQRVALARALAIEPELLLLDEPTANLDPTNVKLMEQAIMTYCERAGATLLLATHNVRQAKRMGQTGIFITNGMVTETGSFPTFLENPGTKELHEFLEWA